MNINVKQGDMIYVPSFYGEEWHISELTVTVVCGEQFYCTDTTADIKRRVPWLLGKGAPPCKYFTSREDCETFIKKQKKE